MRIQAESITTHCPYCALQCGMHLVRGANGIEVGGNEKFPVNEGGLCIKGWAATATLAHPDRLLTPLMRNSQGVLVEASWAIALKRIADRVGAVQRKYGPDAVGVFGGG